MYVSAGYDHSCALLIGGVVKCWGDNGYGGLLLGHTTNTKTATGAANLGAGACAEHSQCGNSTLIVAHSSTAFEIISSE